MKVEFYRHRLSEDIIPEVARVFDSVFLTSGPVTDRFEHEFSRYLGVKRTVGVTSCTAGLFLCLKSWGIGPGDEVLVPAMTFVATVNVVLHCGAVPVFVDVDPETGLMDLTDAGQKVSSHTRAVICVHLYGQMVDMETFRAFADSHDLYLLEDAAHCIEGSRNGIRPGELGDAVCFSFYATKNLTCGEGGAVSTNDETLADRIKILRLHGLNRDAAARYHQYRHWDMVELGYKYNMNDIQAAILLPQLKTIGAYHRKRKRVYDTYIARLTDASLPVKWAKITPHAEHAYHLFVISVHAGIRDRLITWLQENDIGIAVNYRAVHLNSYYTAHLGTAPGMCPHAEKMGDEVISLPFYPSLETKSIEYVVSVMSHFFSKEGS